MTATIENDITRLADLGRAMGHPARVTIIRELIQHGECIGGDLADLVPLAPSTVSQHLKVLRDAGWITGRVDGPRRCYCVDPAALEDFARLVSELQDAGASTES